MNQINAKKSAEISVFVPSYNHAPFIEKCLRSIFKQTIQPKTLLVIDDGSKDDSPRIIEKLLNKCPFDAELIVRENRGLSATLNEGLAKTSGEFFAYLGSDDVWLSNFLERRSAFFKTNENAVLSCGHAFLIDENDFIIDRTDYWTKFSGGNMLPFLLRGQIFASSSVIYRRNSLEKYGWNESSILEDYELYLKLASDGDFAFDGEILSAWRQHGWNVSGDFPLMMREWLSAQNRVLEKLKIERKELEKIQTELKFDSVLSFVRHGHRVAAVKLFYENLSGAKSLSQIGKTLFRLTIPPILFDWNRNRKRQKMIERYGKLDF